MIRDDLIREAMGRKNLNITELAELSGISRAVVSNIANGNAESCNLSTLKAIADVLELSMSDILSTKAA